MKTQFYVKVYTGLLEGKHVKKIGEALWLLLELINRTTHEIDGRGIVLNGGRIEDAELAKRFNIHRNTVTNWREKLVEGGYITARRTKWGYSYTVLKSKKYAPVVEGGNSSNA